MFHLDTVVAGVYTHFFHWNSWFISHWGRCKPEFFSPCDVNVSQKTFALIYLTSLPRQPVFSRVIGLRINKYLAFLPHLSVDKCNVDLQIHVHAALQRVRAALDGHGLHPRGCGMAWAWPFKHCRGPVVPPCWAHLMVNESWGTICFSTSSLQFYFVINILVFHLECCCHLARGWQVPKP